ncbi:hypothetical protein DFJ74DRAFT_762882 [Hyaloraphidium curvatum]|nr:hypothetical protein DFJ74DRAFT_762882 [Hyaloraphidium curvatum]
MATSSKAPQPQSLEALALQKRILNHLKAFGSRLVVHIDLDAFYCQVEMVRTGSPEDQPLCVQQWNGLIAVNYPARAKGIKRHSTVEDALKLCPELTLVHVATYAQGSHAPAYHPDPKYATHKVSLKPYREASSRIFAIIERHVPPSHGTVERASIDEAYVEAGEIVNRRIAARFVAMLDEPGGSERALAEWEAMEQSEDGPEVAWGPETFVVGLPDAKERTGEPGSQDVPRKTRGWHDLQLHEGAKLVREIRAAIRSELGYTCSAGIGSNKMLAKLVSALNKPDKQTALRHAHVLDFMRDLPFTKIRNLGGKFGEQVEAEYGASTVSDLWQYSRDQLQQKFGAQSGSWLFDAVRGINSDEVVRRTKAGTMMSAKSFRPPLRTMDEVKHWLDVLAWEIHDRITEDYDVNGRWSKTLVLHLKSNALDKSRTCAFPPRHMCNGDVISQRAFDMFRQEGDGRALPLFHCSLQAGSLFGDKGSGAIEKFLGKKEEPVEGRDDDADGFADGEDGDAADRQRKEPAEPQRTSWTSAPPQRTIPKQNASVKSFFGSKQPPDTQPPAHSAPPAAQAAAPIELVDAPADVPTAEIFVCYRCSRSFPAPERAEHEDYHFALDLSRENRVVLGGTAAGTKRKQPPSARGGSGEKKLTSFFRRE